MDLPTKLDQIITLVREDFSSVRVGRASPELVERILVDAYGAKMKLIELATINVSDPQTLTVTPFDSGNIQAIIKAVEISGIGLTPMLNGGVIRLNIPTLTTERRRELIKLLSQKLEAGRVMIRQARHETMEDLRKQILNEDEISRQEKEIQKQIDNAIAQIEIMAGEREKQLSEI